MSSGGLVRAVDVLRTSGLTISEYFGAASSGDEQLSACLATATGTCGEVYQLPEFDEYIMVISGELRIACRDQTIAATAGEGLFLKAGERVLWMWPGPCLYVIVCLPTVASRNAIKDSKRPAEHQGSTLPPLPPHHGDSGVPAGGMERLGSNSLVARPCSKPVVQAQGAAGTLSIFPRSSTKSAGPTEEPHGGSEDATETEATGATMQACRNIPEYMAGCGDLSRISSCSALDQLLDTKGLLELRGKQELCGEVHERPVRYGARHLSTPMVVVASELNPWSKTGGLAVVTAAYAYEFALRGHRTMAVSPYYEEYEDCRYAGHARIWLNGQHHEVKYFHHRQELGVGQGCDYVFVGHQSFPRPEGLYGDPARGGEYEDNLFRFALLSLAAAEAPLVLNLGGSAYGEEVCFIANDWHTGLLPLYLLHKYKRNRTYRKARCIMVVHNLGYQGRYRRCKYPTDEFFGLPLDAAQDLRAEDAHLGDDCINLISAGIRLADRVLTVSPNYALEIQSLEGGHGLHELVRKKASSLRLAGILNGISDEWNPLVDPHIVQRYGPHDFAEGKRACKATLQWCLGLQQDPDVALVGFCGRLCCQKGVHLITAIIPWLMHDQGNGVNGRVQIVLMGKGDPSTEHQLRSAENAHRGRVCGYVGFDPVVEHQMMAGCDLLLMPSQYEPCGLPQMYAQQYGTLPVAHRTGGLKDSIRGLWDDARNHDTATGFLFSGFHADHLKACLYKAMDTFHHHVGLFRRMQLNAIQSNYYWPKAIDEYEKHLDYTMEDTPCFS